MQDFFKIHRKNNFKDTNFKENSSCNDSDVCCCCFNKKEKEKSANAKPNKILSIKYILELVKLHLYF